MSESFNIRGLSIILFAAVGAVEQGMDVDQSASADGRVSILLMAPSDPRELPTDTDADLVIAPRTRAEALELANVLGQMSRACIDLC